MCTHQHYRSATIKSYFDLPPHTETHNNEVSIKDTLGPSANVSAFRENSSLCWDPFYCLCDRTRCASKKQQRRNKWDIFETLVMRVTLGADVALGGTKRPKCNSTDYHECQKKHLRNDRNSIDVGAVSNRSPTNRWLLGREVKSPLEIKSLSQHGQQDKYTRVGLCAHRYRWNNPVWAITMLHVTL